MCVGVCDERFSRIKVGTEIKEWRVGEKRERERTRNAEEEDAYLADLYSEKI